MNFKFLHVYVCEIKITKTSAINNAGHVIADDLCHKTDYFILAVLVGCCLESRAYNEITSIPINYYRIDIFIKPNSRSHVMNAYKNMRLLRSNKPLQLIPYLPSFKTQYTIIHQENDINECLTFNVVSESINISTQFNAFQSIKTTFA